MIPGSYIYPDYSTNHAPQSGMLRFQCHQQAEQWAERANLDGPVVVLVFNTIYGFAPAAQMTLEVR
jgi:hypothetical protein